MINHNDHRVKGIDKVLVCFRADYLRKEWMLGRIEIKSRNDDGPVVGTLVEIAPPVDLSRGAKVLVKKYDLDDDLDEIKGTGKNGRILKDDVEAYIHEVLNEDDEEPAPKKAAPKKSAPKKAAAQPAEAAAQPAEAAE
jgi:pyruvate/2-oxoglutarate dehydrogenase complex dihydrolipoamide acyltransferase (E2) component